MRGMRATANLSKKITYRTVFIQPHLRKLREWIGLFFRVHLNERIDTALPCGQIYKTSENRLGTGNLMK